MFSVTEYLQEKGLGVKASGSEEVHFACPFCGEAPEKAGRCYVNVSESPSKGLFICFLCGEKGSFNKIRSHFGDPPLDFIRGEEEENGRPPDDTFMAILDEASKFYQANLTQAPEVYQYLREDRGLTLETIKKFRLGWANGGLTTHLLQKGFSVEQVAQTGLVNPDGTDALRDRITIPYLSMGSVTLIRGRAWGTSKAKYLQPSGMSVGLFNEDSLRGASRVLVCEGEFDTMTADQLGFSAVGVPGVSSWKPKWTDLLSHAKRVFVVFDNDKAGRDGAQKTAGAIGDKSRVVSLPDSLPGEQGIDINRWYVHYGKTKEDFDYLLSQASGGLLVSPAQAHEKWLEIQANPSARLKLAIPVLDRAMEYGLPPGAVFIVTAATSAGKTTGALNLFHRMSMQREDMSILYISLEQTRAEWFETAHRIHKFYDPAVSPLDTVEFWGDRLYMVDKNRLTASQLQDSIRQYKYEVNENLRMVCVDYLGYYARSYPGGDEFHRTTEAVMDLKRIAKEEEVVIYSPSQIGRGKGVAGESHGAGKSKNSVTGDTRVLCADGQYVPIRDLVGQTPTLVAVDNKYQLQPARASLVWKKPEPKDIYKLTTSSGRVVRGTSEHPLLTADREWVTIGDLRVGDKVAVARNLPFFGTVHYEHAELVGAMIADGGLRGDVPTYTEEHKEIRDRTCALAEKVGCRVRQGRTQYDVAFPSAENPPRVPPGRRFTDSKPNPLRALLEELGLYWVKSPNRFIPDEAYLWDKQSVAALLRGLISADGCAMTRKGIIKYSTTSRTLAEGVQHLLSRFGIWATLDEGQLRGLSTGPIYDVMIRRYSEVKVFAEEIGLSGPKGRKLQQIAATPQKKAQCVDLFPHSLWDELHAERRSRGLGWSVLSKIGNPRRTSIVKGRDISRDRLRFFAEAVGSARLEALANSDLEFDPVVSIDWDGVEDVYDAEVPGFQNFIGAQGLALHNSGAVEETADLEMSLWNRDQKEGITIAEHTGVIGMKIEKIRPHIGSGLHVLAEMKYSPLSRALVPLDDPLCAKVDRERAWHMAGVSWEEACKRHVNGDFSI